MRIGFCFNVKHPSADGFESELDCDAPETIAAISQTIRDLGHTVTDIEADVHVFTKLEKLKGKIDLIFNMSEGLYGDARESWVPMACEILKIPYTHSSPTVHALKLDKTLAKLAVAGLGIRVPKTGPEAKFPMIVKPNCEGSSIGVFNACVVDNAEQLERQEADLKSKGFTGRLMTEEYIDGREFTVGVLGYGDNVRVLPIIEQKFGFLPAGMKPIAGYELKWLVEDQLKDLTVAYDCPPKLPKNKIREIEDISRKIYTGLGVRDCARIDYRMDKRGRLYFLEINTVPGINPDEKTISYLPLAARTAGLTFPQLVATIIDSAVKRQKI